MTKAGLRHRGRRPRGAHVGTAVRVAQRPSQQREVGRPGTSLNEPEDDGLALEFRSSPIGATLICPDIHEDDQLAAAQLAAWAEQTSLLPDERM
jgi:hypothetical protein